MTKNYKHYTFQEYIEQFSSIQDSYDYYFEMQKEIDKLNEYNIHLIKSISNYEELLLEKNNIIDKAIEYIKEINNHNYSILVNGKETILDKREILDVKMGEMQKLERILRGKDNE